MQLTRGQLKVVSGPVTKDYGFAAVASMSEWARTGGTPTGEGWCVDRAQRGADPVYGDDELRGLLQYWTSGTTEMIDVPGIRTPWVTNRPGDVLTTSYEFETWILAPCAAAGLIDDALVDELLSGGVGGGGAPATSLPCETFPNQPQRPLRIPVGRIEWGFKLVVRVGADAPRTSGAVSDTYYRWIAGGPRADSHYVALMNLNYPDWVPR